MRAEHLLGRMVVTLNGHRLGRIEEFHVRTEGGEWVVAAFALGPAGLFERLGLSARRVIGLTSKGYRVNWDQLTVAEKGALRLACSVKELQGPA